MKASLLGLLFTVTVTGSALALDPALPSAFPADRYEKLVENSPFSLATPAAPVAPTENVAGFAEGWYVGGLARMDGQDFVTIKSRDQSVQFSLFGAEENREYAVALDRVEWSPDIGKSKVTIRKGAERANLEFNQAEMQTAAPAAPVAVVPRAGVPRPVGNLNAGVKSPAANNPNGLVPPRLAVPRLPNAQPGLPQPGVAPAGPNTGSPPINGVGRRRIRVINGGQNVAQ